MGTKQEQTKLKNTQCPVCGKFILGSSYKFKSHLYQHSAVTSRFKCSYCSKEFFRRDVYEKHVAVHTHVRNYYICDYCERNFVDKRNLINHLKIHDEYFQTSRTQYKCLVCSAHYCEERLLKYHIRKHHFNLKAKESICYNKKPNETWIEQIKQSDVCVEMTKVDGNTILIKKSTKTEKIPPSIKTQSQKAELQDYISSIFANKETTHYSKAICDYCNKEMLKKSLQSHIRERHLKLRRFQCMQCKLSFNRHYQLVNHICGKVRRRRRE